ncbi:hypothetical protein [Methylopila sp. 73B]|uniref:hypothetical protein n=1 Tax=Methylopila sp. 73B TaxID=1120792 RepID=UPI0009DCF496|nr:hypothetical protein [Methylopila sp. 73B]
MSDLEKFAKAGPPDRTGALVMSLLSSFPRQATNADAGDAKGEGYAIALDDLPSWAVRRAVGFWLRSEHGAGRENYAFAPSPPELRRLALIAAAPVRGDLMRLRRLLSAEVERDITDKERAANLERLQGIVKHKELAQ